MIEAQPSILVSDDDAGFRETLQEVFDPLGFHIFLAADGEEALYIYQQEPIHVVVTDLEMPRLSGLEMIHQLHEWNANLPCILISAQPKLQETALQEEVFSVVPKPFSRDQIRLAVSEALASVYNWPPDREAS